MKRQAVAWVALFSALSLMAAAPVYAKGEGARSHVRTSASDSTGTSVNRAAAACRGACSTSVRSSSEVTTTGTQTNSNGISVSNTTGGTKGVAVSSGTMSNSVSGNTTTTSSP